MSWVVFVAGAVLSWGLYGVSLHRGQLAIGNSLKALICVGIAYLLIAVLIPAATLSAEGELKNFNSNGAIISTTGMSFCARRRSRSMNAVAVSPSGRKMRS